MLTWIDRMFHREKRQDERVARAEAAHIAATEAISAAAARETSSVELISITIEAAQRRLREARNAHDPP